MRVSPAGEVIEEHSIIDSMYESDLGGMLVLGRGFRSEVEDPLHANDVEYLDAEMADAFPMFEAGDLMVSLHEIATVAVLDGATRRMKWFMTGPFFGQHDPDFLPNGNILLYDNRITGPRPEPAIPRAGVRSGYPRDRMGICRHRPGSDVHRDRRSAAVAQRQCAGRRAAGWPSSRSPATTATMSSGSS